MTRVGTCVTSDGGCMRYRTAPSPARGDQPRSALAPHAPCPAAATTPPLALAHVSAASAPQPA
eukprot:1613772-Prymnesium_polylepis.1